MGSIKIKGMSCQHCVMAVKKALQEIEGLTEIEVSLEKGEATFKETQAVDPGLVKEKVKKAGYEAVG